MEGTVPPLYVGSQRIYPIHDLHTGSGETTPSTPGEEKKAHSKDARSSNEGGEEDNLSAHPSLCTQLFPINSFTLCSGGRSSAGLKPSGPTALA